MRVISKSHTQFFHYYYLWKNVDVSFCTNNNISIADYYYFYCCMLCYETYFFRNVNVCDAFVYVYQRDSGHNTIITFRIADFRFNIRNKTKKNIPVQMLIQCDNVKVWCNKNQLQIYNHIIHIKSFNLFSNHLNLIETVIVETRTLFVVLFFACFLFYDLFYSSHTILSS